MSVDGKTWVIGIIATTITAISLTFGIVQGITRQDLKNLSSRINGNATQLKRTQIESAVIQSQNHDIYRRLERIETKLDELLEARSK